MRTWSRSGNALAYRKYSSEYVPEEEMARAKKRGLHRGTFVAPWDWRRGKRLNIKPCLSG